MFKRSIRCLLHQVFSFEYGRLSLLCMVWTISVRGSEQKQQAPKDAIKGPKLCAQPKDFFAGIPRLPGSKVAVKMKSDFSLEIFDNAVKSAQEKIKYRNMVAKNRGAKFVEVYAAEVDAFQKMLREAKNFVAIQQKKGMPFTFSCQVPDIMLAKISAGSCTWSTYVELYTPKAYQALLDAGLDYK